MSSPASTHSGDPINPSLVHTSKSNKDWYRELQRPRELPWEPTDKLVTLCKSAHFSEQNGVSNPHPWDCYDNYLTAAFLLSPVSLNGVIHWMPGGPSLIPNVWEGTAFFQLFFFNSTTLGEIANNLRTLRSELIRASSLSEALGSSPSLSLFLLHVGRD